MAQILPLQFAPQAPAPHGGGSSGPDHNQFSPHLDKAIAKQNDKTAPPPATPPAKQGSQTQNTTSSKDTTGDTGAVSSDQPAENSTEHPEQTTQSQKDTADSTQQSSPAATGKDNVIGKDNQWAVGDAKSEFAATLQAPTVATTDNEFELQQVSAQQSGSVTTSGSQQGMTDWFRSPGLALGGETADDVQHLLFGRSTTLYTQQSSQLSIDISITTAGRNLLADGQGGAQRRDALLAQLQQIIDNGNEMGTVTVSGNIRSAGGQMFMNELQTSLSAVYTGEIIFEQGPGPGPATQLPPLRQDAQQQYYDAKLSLQATEKKDGEQVATTSPEGQKNSDNSTPQQGGSTFTQTIAATGQTTHDTPSTFSQGTQGLQPGSTVSITDPGKAIILPSGVTVHEHEVIQQIVERFHINRRMHNTQLNIRLHPAELGELKIDLTVAEGSIKANVIAQSQQVQEIIEKNMAKLRTILEDQGFTVEEIAVATESESVEDFNLFDQHLFSGNDDPTPSGKSGPMPVGDLLFDGVIDETIAQTSSGVNVQA